MEIKICGITSLKEIEYLNEYRPDYAGFVFYEKSKRNLTGEKALELMKKLTSDIKKVAVMVSPDCNFIEKISALPFDVYQIHRELKEEVLKASAKPVWYAVNISDEEEFRSKLEYINSLPEELSSKIEAIVVDAPDFGGGKPFNWRKSKRLKKAGSQSPPEDDFWNGRKFVLAGGLTPENVKEGIEIFNPDVVDVSSGVEGAAGKDELLVKRFIENAVNTVINERKQDEQ